MQLAVTLRAGSRLLSRGEALGKLILLLGVIIFVFGVAEVQVVFGSWFGLLVMLSTCRPQPVDDGLLPRHQTIAPGRI